MAYSHSAHTLDAFIQRDSPGMVHLKGTRGARSFSNAEAANTGTIATPPGTEPLHNMLVDAVRRSPLLGVNQHVLLPLKTHGMVIVTAAAAARGSWMQGGRTEETMDPLLRITNLRSTWHQ
jgi:hypothetical protein